MRPSTLHHYENVIRWDNIPGSDCNHRKDLFSFDKITVELHENKSSSNKDKYVLSMCLELLTGQRVSPRVLSYGNYKKRMVLQKQDTSPRCQVTLRKKKLFSLLDKMLFTTCEETALSSVSEKQLGLNNASFYFVSPLQFRELSDMTINLYKTGPLKLHIRSKGKKSVKKELSNFQLLK
jgi:ribosomal protein L5